MKSTSEYLQLLKQFKDTKANSYGIQKIGLFGSVARGEQREGSDADLEDLFGCSVDIVRLRDKMDSFFKQQIMKEVIYV